MMRKNIYFLSDTHLGAKVFDNPLEFERRVVRFLDSIKNDAKAVYLLGDIIDFWYEFKTVVPRGFNRFFGKLGELTDMGVEVHWFAGNHDIWLFDYMPTELGVIVHEQSLVTEIDGKKFFLAHGDGLGDDSTAYKFMKGFFHNKFCQKMFSMIHPRWSVAFAKRWSQYSRENGELMEYMGEDKEHLILFAKEILKTTHVDYFIFGHRHIMLDMQIAPKSRILILGEWISLFSYAVYDGENIWLEQFEPEEPNRENQRGISIAH